MSSNCHSQPQQAASQHLATATLGQLHTVHWQELISMQHLASFLDDSAHHTGRTLLAFYHDWQFRFPFSNLDHHYR